jgi:AcrR family transcriptional regulator
MTAPPTTTIRTRKQEERRARVIQAALTLASEGGYDAVQMRDVSARAEVAMGTIYRYFSSKDELLVAGLADWASVIRNHSLRKPLTGTTLADRVAGVLVDATRMNESQATLLRALMTALASGEARGGGHHQEVAAALDEIIDRPFEGATGFDVDGVKMVIHHVWSSAFARFANGNGTADAIAEDLARAAHLLLDHLD